MGDTVLNLRPTEMKGNDMPRNGTHSISVIVATRNRSTQLWECLRRFAELDVSTLPAWEVIVVDNGSTDDTAKIIEAFQRQNGELPLTCIFEPLPGVSAARNAGIAVARYDILAFTDDDCRVASSWLAAIQRSFAADPAIVMVGGRVDLFDPEDYEIATRRFDDRFEVSTIDDMFTRLIGCNISISADAVRRAGLFDTAMGPGTSFNAGEDHELFYRILKSGAKIVYNPDVRVEHAHGRRASGEVQALKANYVRGRATIFGKHIRAGDRDLIKRVYWELRAYLSSRQRPDGSKGSPELNSVGIYILSLVRSFLFLR